MSEQSAFSSAGSSSNCRDSKSRDAQFNPGLGDASPPSAKLWTDAQSSVQSSNPIPEEGIKELPGLDLGYVSAALNPAPPPLNSSEGAQANKLTALVESVAALDQQNPLVTNSGQDFSLYEQEKGKAHRALMQSVDSMDAPTLSAILPTVNFQLMQADTNYKLALATPPGSTLPELWVGEINTDVSSGYGAEFKAGVPRNQ